jgi:RND family efflux transporter MFP subunit
MSLPSLPTPNPERSRERRSGLALFLIPLTLLGALPFSGCGPATAQQAEEQAPAAPSVTVALPLQREIEDWDEYVGRFKAIQSVEVRPQASGVVRARHFRDGQIVKRGDLLFTLDPRPFQAASDRAQASAAQSEAEIARAEAGERLAQIEFNRAQALLKAEAISLEEFEQRREALRIAQADLRAAGRSKAGAQANVRAAAIDLGYTQVRSPISGRVSDARVDPGNVAEANVTLLTTVVSLDPIHFEFDAGESLYLKYKRLDADGSRLTSRETANPVQLRLEDETEFVHQGRMDFVDNEVNSATGTIRGRAVFANADDLFTPGQFARMRLLGSGRYTAMLIPDSAVNADQSRKFVWVIGPDDTASQRLIELGPMIDGLRVVRSGLAANDRIVVNGLQRVQAGQKVTPRLTRLDQAGVTDAGVDRGVEPKAAAQ